MFVVTDIQAVEIDTLEHVPGVYVEYEGKDTMGAHRVAVYGSSTAEVVEYVRSQWGDEDPDWFASHIVGRVEETSQVPIPDLAAGADHSGNPTPGEHFVVRMVEDAWYDVTKGEINPDEDTPVRDVILALYRLAREQTDTTAAWQVNRFGREYLNGERVEMEEIANRIARALSIVWFGDA